MHPNGGKIILQGARLLDPGSGLDDHCSLYIDSGLIAGIGEAPANFVADTTLTVDGQTICPGLIDLRSRLAPVPESKADIASEAKAAVAGGITSLACMPDNRPMLDTPASVHLLLDKAKREGFARVFPLGALTQNIAGKQLSEMASLAKAGCNLLTNAGSPVNSLITRRAMEYAATFGLSIMAFGEDSDLANKGCAHEGSTGLRLGLQTIPTTAEEIGISRDIALAELAGCRIHFAAISSARGVALIKAAQARGLSVSADVGIHQLLLNDQDILNYGSLCHLRPPLRDESDRLALIEGLKSGVISALCSDHLPNDADAKLAPFPVSAPGAVGFELLLPLGLSLVRQHHFDLPQLIAALTSNPAQILSLPPPGIKIGKVADLAVFDPAMTWTPEGNNWHSKSTNSPFYGRPLMGRVTHTLISGQLVYRLGKQASEFFPRRDSLN